jgi:subtilisin family serine protease
MTVARALLSDAVRGGLLITLKLGEMPAHIPGWRACTRHGATMADRIDGGALDRILRHHGGALRAVRLHSARTPRRDRDVAGAYRFDDVEQISGVARVLRVRVSEPEGVPALLQALAELPIVERVAPVRMCHTPSAHALAAAPVHAIEAAAWVRRCTRIDEALRLEGGDPAVLVGLADTGVALAHPELRERLRAGFDSVDLDPATVGGVTLVGDFRRAGERPQDEVGHGSGCAGILVARGDGMPPGAAGACGLTPVRVLGAALGPGDKRVGIGALDNIDAGMKRLIDLGVKVINMSFGTPESMLTPDAPRPHEEVVRYALARGTILVAASGNSGLTEKYFPAAHEGVIAVGAIGADQRPASFSTRGAHVALCAPGRDILTCGLDGYQQASGTSFAAPHVAAICALLAARAQRRAWPLDGDDARDLLVSTASPFSEAGVTGCGAGVLDALGALQALDAAIDRRIRDEDASDDVPPALAA